MGALITAVVQTINTGKTKNYGKQIAPDVSLSVPGFSSFALSASGRMAAWLR